MTGLVICACGISELACGFRLACQSAPKGAQIVHTLQFERLGAAKGEVRELKPTGPGSMKPPVVPCCSRIAFQPPSVTLKGRLQMARFEKTLRQVLSGTSDANVSFAEGETLSG